jgi:D-alanyl-D-alanine carboxypeptidase-like protein
VRVSGERRRAARIPVRARATAELAPGAGGAAAPGYAAGGGYTGPLAYRNGKPMRPDVARAFDRLAAGARREAGLQLIVVSGFRSDAEQARLFGAHPDPKWVAPPGKSLHRYATELDLGPNAAYGWLAANARRFGFIKRYAWVRRLESSWWRWLLLVPSGGFAAPRRDASFHGKRHSRLTAGWVALLARSRSQRSYSRNPTASRASARSS